MPRANQLRDCWTTAERAVVHELCREPYEDASADVLVEPRHSHRKFEWRVTRVEVRSGGDFSPPLFLRAQQLSCAWERLELRNYPGPTPRAADRDPRHEVAVCPQIDAVGAPHSLFGIHLCEAAG